MASNITIGSYYPGKSIIHRLDARTKIVLTLLFMVCVFLVDHLYGYAFMAVFFGIVIFLTGIPFSYFLRSLKPLLFILVFTVVLNIFFVGGKDMLFEWGFIKVYREGLRQAAFLGLRLVFLIAGATVMTLTASPIELTDGIERLMSPLRKVRFPVHEMAMMMSIALRFIPTLLDETEKIKRAQMARGADFESGNIFKRAKAMIPLLVPLFISAFRRADELALAMEARCYKGGDGRTKMRESHFALRDIIATVIVVVFGILLALFA